MTRTWWENEDILEQFRDWLSQTSSEVAELAASKEDSVAEATAAEDEDDFSDEPEWMRQRCEFEQGEATLDDSAVHEPEDAFDLDDAPAPDLPTVGLIELIEAFTALRHETKLQTKGSRGLEDSVQSALHGLNSAIRQFESVQSREEEAAARATKPFAEALANLDEALSRGADAISASHRQTARAIPQQLRASLDRRFQAQSSWRQWLSRQWHATVLEICEAEVASALDETAARVMEGYELIQARLQRVMQEHHVARIECIGLPLDPARMTVVELLDDPTVEPETVLEEIRPGYTHQGRVIRFAEVRVARKQTTAAV